MSQSPAHPERPILHRSHVEAPVQLRAHSDRVGIWFANVWQRLLMGLIVLEIPLQLDKYFNRNVEEVVHGANSGFNISLTTICLVFLYLQWVPRLVVESKPIRVSRTLTAYVGLVALSALWAIDKTRTIYEIFLIGQGYLIFVYFVNHIRQRTDILYLFTLMMGGLFIQGILMTITRITGDDIYIGPLSFTIYSEQLRAMGSLGSPNVASSYIALLLAPVFSFLFLPVSKRVKLLAVCTLISGGIALFATLSRGGWIASAVSISIFCVVAARRRWISPPVFTGMVTLAILAGLALMPAVINRFAGDDNGSAAARIPLNEISWEMVEHSPWGVGANNWDLGAQEIAATSSYREAWFYFAHNKYLLVLAEIGWLGLLAFCSFLISIVVWGFLAVNRTNQALSPLVLALTAGFMGQMVHMSFDVFNARAQIQMICLMAALTIATAKMVMAQEEEKTASEIADTSSTGGAS